eukprot:6920841-Prymnesium_polylepis.1
MPAHAAVIHFEVLEQAYRVAPVDSQVDVDVPCRTGEVAATCVCWEPPTCGRRLQVLGLRCG